MFKKLNLTLYFGSQLMAVKTSNIFYYAINRWGPLVDFSLKCNIFIGWHLTNHESKFYIYYFIRQRPKPMEPLN